MGCCGAPFCCATATKAALSAAGRCAGTPCGTSYAVDALDQLKVVGLEARVRADVHAGFEHGVNRLVELLASGLALLILEIQLAELEVLLGVAR